MTCNHENLSPNVECFWENGSYWRREYYYCPSCNETVTKEYVVCQ